MMVMIKKNALISKKISKESVVNISKEKSCRVLRTVVKNMKSTKLPNLSKHYKMKPVSWVKKYMKIDFTASVFGDEHRAILDEPDDWARN